MTPSITYSLKNRILDPRFLAAAAFVVLLVGPLSAAADASSVALTADKTSGSAPLTVMFTSTTSDIPFCGNTTTWDFGDGAVLSSTDSCAPYNGQPVPLPSNTHTYNSVGVYSATLKINQTTSNAVTITSISSMVTPSVNPPTATTPATSTDATATAQVQAQITALQGQLQALIAAKSSASTNSTPASGGTTGSGMTLGGGNTLSGNMSVGARGDNATALQVFLTTMGYYNGPVTGYFGTLTRAGVIKFQQAHNLPATGFVGAMTRAAIQSSTLPSH